MSKTMKFKLSAYIIPSIISMLVVGTNANIDGFFIGNILGDDGLAAINIAWPIVAFVASLGTGIGVGEVYMLVSLYRREMRCIECFCISRSVCIYTWIVDCNYPDCGH